MPSSASSSAWRYAVLMPPLISVLVNGLRKTIRLTSTQGRVDLLQRARSRAQLLGAEAVERHVGRVHAGVKVAGTGVHVDEARHQLARRGAAVHVVHCRDTVMRVI